MYSLMDIEEESNPISTVPFLQLLEKQRGEMQSGCLGGAMTEITSWNGPAWDMVTGRT
jgi:hypothetical protein